MILWGKVTPRLLVDFYSISLVMYIDINVRPLETGHFVALQLSLI